MKELDILIEEIECTNMSRLSKKYIYESLLDIRKKLAEENKNKWKIRKEIEDKIKDFK